MALKDFFRKTQNMFSKGISKAKRPIEKLHHDINKPEAKEKVSPKQSALIAAEATRVRQERSIEKLEQIEKRFTDLVNNLDSINNNLKAFPGFVESQKQLAQHFAEYMQTASENDQKLIKTIEELGERTEKQNTRFIYIVSAIVGGGIVIAMIMILINYLWL